MTGALLALALGVPVGADIIDRVLAIVGGQLVTLSDVHVALALKLVDPAGAADPIDVALSYLIDRRLVVSEVDRYLPPEPDQGATERRMTELRRALPADASTAPGLARIALDDQRLRAVARDDLRIETHLGQRFAAVVPTDEDVERYYRDHPADFTRDAVRLPLDAVREDARRRLAAARRTRVIENWIADLRRRVDVNVLYLPARLGSPR